MTQVPNNRPSARESRNAPAVRSRGRGLRVVAVAAVALFMLGGCAESGAGEGPSLAGNGKGAENANGAGNGAKPGLRGRDVARTAGIRFASAYGDFLAGQFANQQRDLSAAADYMTRALRDDPDNPALMQQTFQLMASDGRIEEASALAERMLAMEAGQPPALMVLAVEELRSGDFDGAAKHAERLPERGLAGVLRPMLLGWLAAERGDSEAALTELEALSVDDGFGVLQALHTALIQDRAGEVEAAREAYGQARSLAGGLSMRLAWLIGNFHERQGEWDEAVAVYRRFLADSPENPAVARLLERAQNREEPAAVVATTADGVSEALFNMAGMLSQQRSAGDVALTYTQLALHLREDFDVARVLLGELLQDQGRSREALAAYGRIPEESPVHETALERAGETLQGMERYDEAAAIFESLAQESPERYEPLQLLGNVYRVQERYEEAEAAYARALDRLDQVENRHWPLLYFHAIALERTGRWEEAEAQFKAALDLEPEQPHVMNYLAYSWVEQEAHLERAQTMLERAVEQQPEDGFIVDSLGWLHYRQGDYETAVGYLERAAELQPLDPVINDHLGDAYWKVGRKLEARFQWLRARRLDPEEDALADIEAKLEGGLEAVSSPNG